MKKSIQLVKLPFAREQNDLIERQGTFPPEGTRFSSIAMSKMFEPINNNEALSSDISSYRDIFSIHEDLYGTVITEIVSDEYNFDEDEGEDKSESEEEWRSPIFVALAPIICGKYTDFESIASILKIQNPDIDIYAIDDNQLGMSNDRSIEAVADQYLNLLYENFPYLLDDSKNVPEGQIIFITYSSSLAIAMQIIMLQQMRSDNAKNVFKIIALDPTPKDYFSHLPGEDESKKSALLLIQSIQTYLTNCPRGLIVQKDTRIGQKVVLSSNKEISDEISLKILDLIKEPSETHIIELKELLIKLSQSFYSIQDSVSSHIYEVFTYIIINFFALYEWHKNSEENSNKSAIQKICRENTLMINAGYSVSPDDGAPQHTHTCINYSKKALGWGNQEGDIRQIEIIPESWHMRFLRVFALDIVLKVAEFYSKIKLEQVKNHIEYIKQLNNHGEKELDYWQNIYDDLMGKLPQEKKNISGKQDDASKAVEVMTKGTSGWGGCMQPISSNNSTSTFTIEEQSVISDELNSSSIISNVQFNN